MYSNILRTDLLFEQGGIPFLELLLFSITVSIFFSIAVSFFFKFEMVLVWYSCCSFTRVKTKWVVENKRNINVFIVTPASTIAVHLLFCRISFSFQYYRPFQIIYKDKIKQYLPRHTYKYILEPNRNCIKGK